MGAPHTVRWSKSFDFVLKQVFSSFSVTNGKKKEKGGESALFVIVSKNDFDQQTAGRAPVRWSKYTTSDFGLCYANYRKIELRMKHTLAFIKNGAFTLKN